MAQRSHKELRAFKKYPILRIKKLTPQATLTSDTLQTLPVSRIDPKPIAHPINDALASYNQLVEVSEDIFDRLSKEQRQILIDYKICDEEYTPCFLGVISNSQRQRLKMYIQEQALLMFVRQMQMQLRL